MDTEEIKNNQNEQVDQNQDSEMDKAPIKTKGKARALIIISLVVIAVVIAAGYFIYEKKDAKRAQFIISSSPISDTREVTEINQFPAGGDVYFLFKLKRNTLNAEVCILEIEYKKEDVYNYYKKITYELGREFPELKALIPSVYFSQSGDYNIKVILDGRLVAERQITIGAP